MEGLGSELDKIVQLYLKKVRDAGGIVTARIAVAVANGILLRHDKCKLVEYGGHIDLSTILGYSLLGCIGFVKRKSTTAKSKYGVEKFRELKHAFLNYVKTVVEMERHPPTIDSKLV